MSSQQAGYFGKDGKRLGKEAKVLVAEGVLDWIIIMGYEMSSGYRHYTGPQAPLYINSKHPWDLDWSIHKSVKYWAEEVGIPRDKIQLGLPAFGKIFQTRLKGEKKKELKPNKDFENSFIYQPQKYPKVQMTPPEGWDDSAPWGTGLKATWERDFCSTYRQNQHGRAAAVSLLSRNVCFSDDTDVRISITIP